MKSGVNDIVMESNWGLRSARECLMSIRCVINGSIMCVEAIDDIKKTGKDNETVGLTQSSVWVNAWKDLECFKLGKT